MKFLDLLRLTVRGATRGKFKTVLTMSAIAIGVMSVVLVLSIGEGSRTAVSEELDKIGLSGISVFPKEVAANAGVRPEGEDAEWLKMRLSDADAVMPLMIRYGSYGIRNWQGNVMIYGVTEEVTSMLNVTLKHGRLFLASDISSEHPVAIVDTAFCETVYGRENIVGKVVTLNISGRDMPFTIVGIIEPQAGGLSQLVGEALPEFVYVPYTALQRMTGEKTVDQIFIKSSEESSGERASAYLDKRYDRTDSFRYENIGGYREYLDSILRLITLFISAVAAISIIVAGIGIMNTMMSNMVERRREIGVYMALGATRRDIILSFLMESALISLLGGAVGIALSALLLYVTNSALHVSFSISPGYIAIAEGIAGLFGVGFGVAPAVRAADLDPVEALRDDG
ncbi:ABC transporter permease [Oscillospiraceae bacterium OttesenSCG-928-G22]|nr:ABC transporter permease [Oscillospiraceae bacterium OttesenSCG-928-G22]